MKLAFTGHRPESLPFGENENDARCIRLKAMLLTEIMDRAKAGTTPSTQAVQEAWTSSLADW